MDNIKERINRLKSFAEANNISVRYRTIPKFTLYLFDNCNGKQIYKLQCDNVDIVDLVGVYSYIQEYKH